MSSRDATLTWPARLGWRWLDKYAALAALAFRQRLDERTTLIGRVMFYALILLIYSRLWEALLVGPDAAALGDHALGATPGSYVWYMAVTEWIMLAQPSVHFDIEADVRGGDVAYQLSRPLSYVGAKLAAASGELVLRWLVLAASGLVFARLLSGEWPSAPGLALALAAGVLASVVMLLAYVAVGLSAFWLHDCMPVYLIWQKLSFTLGGLMLPLGIYPPWLRAVAEHTPFSALLYGPGQLVVHPDSAAALRLLLTLSAWGAIGLGVVLLLEQRARRNLCLHGG